MRRVPRLLALASLAAASSALAAPDLRIGDRAPDMDIEHWIKMPGGVDAIEPGDGNVYVLDFWATWCTPCIAGFGAVSELQENYADEGVIVVAVSDEPREAVSRFLRLSAGDAGTQSDRMRFVVATDPDLSTRQGVLEASSRYVLPQGMIIGRDGVIEWVGHPKNDGLEDALRAYLAGEWDRESYRGAFEERLATKLSSKEAFDAAVENEQWEAAVELAGERWERLNSIAFKIALNAGGAVQNRDLALAERLARRSIELTGGEEGFPLHVLGMLLFEQGEVAEAVELEERALALEGEGGTWTGYYTQTLAAYRAALEEAQSQE